MPGRRISKLRKKLLFFDSPASMPVRAPHSTKPTRYPPVGPSSMPSPPAQTGKNRKPGDSHQDVYRHGGRGQGRPEKKARQVDEESLKGHRHRAQGKIQPHEGAQRGKCRHQGRKRDVPGRYPVHSGLLPPSGARSPRYFSMKASLNSVKRPSSRDSLMLLIRFSRK